jgi:cell division GTPase FtsZ
VQSPNRALEFAVLGLGQAGGNLAAEFYRRGYLAIAVNTARSDLQSLNPGGLYPPLPEENQIYIGLENCDGAGADAEYAAECVQAHADLIFEQAERMSKGIDVLFLAAGLGGGTGSAAATVLNILSKLDVPIVGLFTLPNDSESAVVKINAIRAVSALVEAPLAGRIFIDNESVESANAETCITEYYPTINAKIVDPLDALNGLGQRDDLHALRNFDGEDFRKLLLSSGVLNYGIVDLPNITVDEVVGALSDSLASSELMPPGFKMESLSFIGLILEAPKDVLDSTAGATFGQIDERIKELTQGGIVYRGLYLTTHRNTRLRIIISAQDLPERLNDVLGAARNEGEILQEKLNSQLPQLELDEIGDFELFPKESKNRASDRPRLSSTAPRPSSSLDSASKSESVKPGRKNPRRRRPVPPKRRSGDRKNSNQDQADAPEFQTKEHPTATPHPIGEEPVPSPKKQNQEIDTQKQAEKYDQMVADYLRAKKGAPRNRIADRLEKDSISALTVIRYHAVDAMCRLGTTDFKDALLAASEDENNEIRQLAMQALSE